MYLGVDSGGTKTSVLIVDDEAKIAFKKIYTSLHIKQIGDDNFKSLFNEIVGDIKIAKLFDKLKGEYFAIPMYTEIEYCDKVIDKTIKSVFPNAQIVNDVMAGWAGALACNSGINVVSGTGSIAVMVDDEKTSVVGGYGHIFGDEGSAYWIGKQLLSAYSMQLDKRAPRTILFDKFSIDEFKSLEYGFNLTREQIASYAVKCDEFANLGCEKSIEILECAATHLVNHVFALSADSCKVSYSGSVFKSNTVLNKFKSLLSSYDIIEPILPPDLGCIFASYININGYSSKYLEGLKSHVDN